MSNKVRDVTLTFIDHLPKRISMAQLEAIIFYLMLEFNVSVEEAIGIADSIKSDYNEAHKQFWSSENE